MLEGDVEWTLREETAMEERNKGESRDFNYGPMESRGSCGGRDGRCELGRDGGGGGRSFTSTPFRWWAKEEHRIIEQPAVVDGISVRRMLKGGRGEAG